MSTIYSVGYSTLKFSKLFTIERGKVSRLRVDYSGGKGCAQGLFIYLFSCPNITVSFWILAKGLTACHFPGLAQHLQKCFLPAQRVYGLEMLFS
jgi:hypothetical protein